MPLCNTSLERLGDPTQMVDEDVMFVALHILLDHCDPSRLQPPSLGNAGTTPVDRSMHQENPGLYGDLARLLDVLEPLVPT